MKKIRVLLIAALLLICTASMTLPVSAGTGIKVNDDMTVEMYDWSATWDANQNNAYIDIVNGIFDMQTEISLRDDYITSLQLMNVAKRISIDHSEWEGVDFESASYTNDGYVDKVTITYTPFHSKETIRELADYTAFGKSLLDETMTDLEKALVLHDYISQRTYYANPESDIGSGASIFLKHRGICGNFAVAYCELLYSAGVPLGFATGSAGNTAHAWANIYIDGKWYASDTTFDAPTDPKDINYTMPQHEYFLRGTEHHVDQFLLSIYNASDNIYGYEIENIEAKDPTAYWDFSDCGSNLAYHVNEGETHGKWYYLSGMYGGPSTKNPLTVRDSLMADAAVTSHPERVYANIAWDGNNLYGFRDNSIYIIDWNTYEETKIAYLENDVLYTLNGGSFEVAQEFYSETSGLTGILAKNGQLTAQITFADGSAKEYTAYTYDKVVSTPSEGAGKVTVSGPTQEPGPILYGFSLFQQDIMNTAASIDGFFGTGTHSDGLQVDELVCDLKITSIGNNAFTDLGADKFSGPLVLNKFILKIGAHAFENCTGITGTVDLSPVNYLEPYAFSGCTGIEKVILCPGRTMEDHVFMGCSSITEAENLDTYNSIGASAFEGCTALSNCIDFHETGSVGEKAFKDCVNISTTPVIKLGTINDYAFENCANIKGPISLPNVGWVGTRPFKNTGITRLLDTDEAWHIVGSLLYDTQIKGILSFPNLHDFREYTFHDADGIDAIRFPNPETKEVNDNPYSLPETTDVAFFVVKDSPMEDLIKDKWTYGVNYWYVDDVIAQGELDNGVVWSISGDGTMTFDLADGVSETVTVSGYSDTTAPWDEYKKYVERINVDNNKIIFGSDAICGFANLRFVSFVKGGSYDENAFAECELLSQENIDTDRCIHDFGEWVRTQEPNCSNTGTEERTCSKCGETETRVIAPLGHDWGEQRIDVEPTEELLGWYIRDCQRCDVHEWQQIPMLVHGEKVTKVEATDATCTTNGCIEHWRCDNCGRLYSDENLEHEITNQGSVVIKALDHDYKEVEGSAVAATCETAGKKADQKCSRCNDVKQGAEIEALGHDWGEWTVVKEATEDEEGLQIRTCTRDPSHTEESTIPKLTHVHNLVRTAPAAATCTEAGNIEFWTCSKCHKIYSDANAENEISEAETVVKATGHTEEDIPAVEATCTNTGKTAGKKCSVCGEILEAPVETPALGHDWSEWAVTKEATCTEEGEEQRVCSRDDSHVDKRTIDAKGHDWDTEYTIDEHPSCTLEGYKSIRCKVCHVVKEGSVTEIPALGHDYKAVLETAVAATCETAGKEADQKCSRCDSTITGNVIEALGHEWGEWVVVQEATEEEEGLKIRTCTRDPSHTEQSTIPKLTHVHDLVRTAPVAATCTEAGNIEYWTCSKCHKLYSDKNAENEISEAETIVKAKGHTEEDIPAVAATCTEKGKTAGKKCSVCGEILVAQEEIPALGHNYEVVEGTAVAATCETAGKEADQKCSRCNSTIEGATIPALGHDWGEWTVTKAATCTEDGEEQRVCSRDESHVEKRTIEAKGHTEVALPAVAATCTEKGKTAGKKCSVCDEILVAQEDIPALGHNYEEIEGTAVAATCETAGKEADQKCSRCDSTITGMTIEALGHDYKVVEGSAIEPTCTDAGKEADQRCSRCDSLIVGLTIEALGHDWDEWVIVKEATEDEEGLEQRVCRRDSKHFEDRGINKLSHVHKLEKVAASNATCDKDGNIEYWTCSKCGKFFADSNATLEITEEETLVKATGHDWTDGRITKEPAAGKEGEMTYTCSICGETYVEPIPALAEEQAEAYEAIDAAEEATGQAQQKAESIDASSSEQALADADKLVSDTAEEASAAVEAAEAAAQKAAAEYGEGSEAVVFAKAKVVQARQTKAKAMAAAAAVKAVAAEAAVQKAENAQSTAAAAAVKPGEEAVKAAQEAEVAAKDYLEKATAAKETADAALEAVVEAGYTEDSEEYKSAAKAVTAAETAKASAETRLAEATAAVTAAEEAKAEEETKEIVDLPKVTISKAVAGKKSATVKWKKLSKKSQNKIYKIQIQYSTDKKFKKYVKTTTAKKTAVSKKISKLKKGKRYYFRIRSYKKISGRVHVSKWSTVKNTKAK